MLKLLETIRKQSTEGSDRARRSELGQFLTPNPVAEFMASLFDLGDHQSVRLLDPGAGIGTLSTAFIEQFRNWDIETSKLTIVAYEVDEIVQPKLSEVFSCISATVDAELKILAQDFVEDGVHQVLFDRNPTYTHSILNPPYKKIRSESEHRSLLRLAGIETVNLYSAFVALAIKLLVDAGQLVAIVPRSFCNGPYYRSFREEMLRETAIRQIHLFGSRSKAFKDDNVLQENVIIHLEKKKRQERVVVSTSTDATFSDLNQQEFEFSRIVYSTDPEKVIHIPTTSELNFHQTTDVYDHSLADLFLEVSTGPVVDFRVKEHTRDLPENGSAPLLYPGHFVGNEIVWPRLNWKKPNAISVNDETRKLLYPSGYYTVVRRFSSKEEKRRIRSYVFDPSTLEDYPFIGFENHFNVFHFRKTGLSKEIAFGLSAFLNSSMVDRYFRQMNGHTQVNATDLRRLQFPKAELLRALGAEVAKANPVEQEDIDSLVETTLNSNAQTCI